MKSFIRGESKIRFEIQSSNLKRGNTLVVISELNNKEKS